MATKSVKFSIEIRDSVDNRFRKAVADKLGMRKGNLTIAIEEAFNDWAEKVEKGKRK
jgi:hypothetical protein